MKFCKRYPGGGGDLFCGSRGVHTTQAITDETCTLHDLSPGEILDKAHLIPKVLHVTNKTEREKREGGGPIGWEVWALRTVSSAKRTGSIVKWLFYCVQEFFTSTLWI